MNRRNFFRGFAAAGVVCLGAGMWRVKTNHVLSSGDGLAYAPWKEWQREGSNPLTKFVQAAILAANPHNSQPWKFSLQPEAVDVYADTSRQIGVIDPFLREMHIGIGCAVENLLLSAEAAGYSWSFTPAAPSVDPSLQPVVRIGMKKQAGQQPSDLYAAIPDRHTNRGPYMVGKKMDADTLNAFYALHNSDSELRIFWFLKPEEMRGFGDLVVRGAEAIVADPEQSVSSARWLRTNWADIERFRDGLTYDMQGMSTGLRTIAKFMPPLSMKRSDQFWLTATRETHVATAAAFGMIAARDAQATNSLLEAGRLWQRMQLLASRRGLAMQPLSQPVERRDRERQLGQSPVFAKALADLQQDDSWQAVMPFRIGYPARKALPSPRRAVASVLI